VPPSARGERGRQGGGRGSRNNPLNIHAGGSAGTAGVPGPAHAAGKQANISPPKRKGGKEFPTRSAAARAARPGGGRLQGQKKAWGGGQAAPGAPSCMNGGLLQHALQKSRGIRRSGNKHEKRGGKSAFFWGAALVRRGRRRGATGHRGGGGGEERNLPLFLNPPPPPPPKPKPGKIAHKITHVTWQSLPISRGAPRACGAGNTARSDSGGPLKPMGGGRLRIKGKQKKHVPLFFPTEKRKRPVSPGGHCVTGGPGGGGLRRGVATGGGRGKNNYTAPVHPCTTKRRRWPNHVT